MTRILIGGFLITHGLVHIGMWGVPKLQTAEGSPFVSSDSWLIGSTRGLAAVLGVLTAVVLIAGGVALFAHSGLWRPLTIVGLAGSLFLDVLYFNPWFIFITVVNGVFLWALVWAHWPAASRVGA